MSRLPLITLLLVATACGSGGGGGKTTPLGGAAVIPEILVCRSRIDNTMNFSEIGLRTAQNLGTNRISDRAGVERRVSLHPDGNTVVFARERAGADPGSRELFRSTIDGSSHELRLTQNTELDDEPSWSPTGSAILYTSERSGSRSLWLCDPDGRNPRQFLTPTSGSSDGQADWCRATDRIVFSRRDSSGRHKLWLVQGDGTGLVQLTNGGTTLGAGAGDHEPTFAPDGQTVVFVRRAGTAASSLCIAEVATSTVIERHRTTGAIGLPRYSPTQDRIFFGIAEPDMGRAGLRLAFVPLTSGAPVLVWPDERYALEGIAMLPTMPALQTGVAPEPLDVGAADLGVAWGSYAFGTQSQLAAEDGNELVLFTRRAGIHETAGIGLTFSLPVADPLDVLEVRVRAVCRVSRIGGDTALRISLYNPVDGRSDTVVEMEPTSTGAHTLAFSTSSLRHVSAESRIRFNIIGEVANGDRAEFHVDVVEVVLVATAITP